MCGNANISKRGTTRGRVLFMLATVLGRRADSFIHREELRGAYPSGLVAVWTSGQARRERLWPTGHPDATGVT
jgi:hypothetical protein